MTFSSFLKDTVSILRKSDTLDEFGHYSNDSYESISTGVKCRIAPISIEEIQASSGMFENSTHRIQFESTVDIDEGDRVYDGTNTYQIKAVMKHYDASSLHHIECIAKKI